MKALLSRGVMQQKREGFVMDKGALKLPAQESSRKGTSTRRIQFEFSPEAYERLQKIKDATEASTYAELVRDALRVYEWLVQQQKEGYELGLIKENKLVKEVKLLF